MSQILTFLACTLVGVLLELWLRLSHAVADKVLGRASPDSARRAALWVILVMVGVAASLIVIFRLTEGSRSGLAGLVAGVAIMHLVMRLRELSTG